MKRTSDGRFIEKRIMISNTFLRKIIDTCKKQNKFTWKVFAKKLNISEHTLRYDFRNKHKTLPKSIFNKLLKFNKNLNYKDIKDKIKILSPFWGQRKNKLKSFIQPKITSELFAEFYGIMLGDGCIYSNFKGICISGDSLVDRHYIKNYISKLIYNLFEIEPKIYYSNQSRSIRCTVYSKTLAKLLVDFGFPKGKKALGNLVIPKLFFKQKKLLKNCLRGLCDTDGSVSFHPHTKIMLHLSITCNSLLNSSIQAFKKLNLPIGFYNKGITMYNQNKLKHYFKLIGSSNAKHILKYSMLLKKGYVPKKEEMETFLKKNRVLNLKLPYHGLVV